LTTPEAFQGADFPDFPDSMKECCHGRRSAREEPKRRLEGTELAGPWQKGIRVKSNEQQRRQIPVNSKDWDLHGRVVEGRSTHSNSMKPILLTAAGNPENQDRGLVIHDGARTVLCVADGAGGRSGGAEAASMAMELIRQSVSQMNNAKSCAEVLRKMDAAIARDSSAGETTCALVIVTSEEVFGASVGDSGIWLVPEKGVHVDLTQGQQRKPFVGSGSGRPVSFRCPRQAGGLLLATDGLLKYTSAERIIAICREQAPEVAARRLIELVRYPSGALPDDVTIILTSL
jgi:serine/threonine protein phosphatase PrpC